MSKAPLLLFILLLVSTTAQAEPWIIEDDTTCTGGELVFNDSIIIKAGARLTLEDCNLKMDTSEYENGWLNSGIEGLLITVEKGGVLEVRSLTRNASIEPLDARYGYTMKVAGSLILEGTEEHHAEIHGLEGYMAEAFLGGGISVVDGGRATANNVTFYKLYGPALFGSNGSVMEVRNAQVVRASGGFAAIEGSTLRLHNVSADMGFEAVRVSKSTLEVTDSELLAGRVGIHATRSNVTVLDSRVASAKTAILLSDSSAEVQNSLLQFGAIGLMHEHKVSRPAVSKVLVENSRIEAFPNRPQTVGIAIQDADFELRSSVLRNYTAAGLSVLNGRANLDSNLFEGNALVHAQIHNARAIQGGNNLATGLANDTFVYTKGIQVDVRDSSGPLKGAFVNFLDMYGITDENGTAEFLWSISTDESGQPDLSPFTMQIQSLDRSRTVEVTFETASNVYVNFDADSGRNSPGIGMLVAFVLVFAVALRRTR